MSEPRLDNIWLQPGTRLHMIIDRVSHWEVWTATNKRTGDSSTWLGTWLELYPDGACIQGIRTETYGKTMEIRQKREETHP